MRTREWSQLFKSSFGSCTSTTDLVHDQTTVGAPASVGSPDLRQSVPDAGANIAGFRLLAILKEIGKITLYIGCIVR